MAPRIMAPGTYRCLQWADGSLVRDAHDEMVRTRSRVCPATGDPVEGTVVELVDEITVRVTWDVGGEVTVPAKLLRVLGKR